MKFSEDEATRMPSTLFSTQFQKQGLGSQSSLNAVGWISPLHCKKRGQQKVDVQNTVRKGTGNVSAELYPRVHGSLGTISKGSSLLDVA